MKKSDLKVGDIVKTRNDKYLVVLPNEYSNDGLSLFSASSRGCYHYLDGYEDDLTCSKNRDMDDIVAVYKTSEPNKNHAHTLIRDILSNEYFSCPFINTIKWDWEEPKIKEVTMAELEALYGCKVKIVKEN